jgi:hypothetical protein
MAQRIWSAPNAIHLSEADKEHGIGLGLIVWPHASNRCNDVWHGRAAL